MNLPVVWCEKGTLLIRNASVEYTRAKGDASVGYSYIALTAAGLAHAQRHTKCSRTVKTIPLHFSSSPRKSDLTTNDTVFPYVVCPTDQRN